MSQCNLKEKVIIVKLINQIVFLTCRRSDGRRTPAVDRMVEARLNNYNSLNFLGNIIDKILNL